MMNSKELGRDAAQETFLKTFKSLKSYKQESSFKTWLFTIARNQCIDFIRKNKKAPDLGLDDSHSKNFTKSTADSLEAKDLARKILNQLSEKNKEVVLLKEAYGMSYDEISKITKSSIDSVKARLKRTRKEMLEIAREFNDTN